LKELSASVDIDNTPVVISGDLKFVTKVKWDADRLSADNMLEAWRADVESTDPNRLRQHYSHNFKGVRGQNLDSLLDKERQSTFGARKISVALRDVTLFRYTDQTNQKDPKELIVATFTQESLIGKGKFIARKRQYWAPEGTQWKIVSETSL
jgi:hypothetical protein